MLIVRSRIRSIKCWRTAPGRLSQRRSWASAAEDHASKLIPQPPGLFRVGRIAEPPGKFEKLLLLPLLRLDSVLDEFHQHPVRAEPPALRQTPNLPRYVCRETDALPYRLACSHHDTSTHQNGAISLAALILRPISDARPHSVRHSGFLRRRHIRLRSSGIIRLSPEEPLDPLDGRTDSSPWGASSRPVLQSYHLRLASSGRCRAKGRARALHGLEFSSPGCALLHPSGHPRSHRGPICRYW